MAESQNRWPSLNFDLGAINDRLGMFFPAGFYNKTFMWPRSFWKHVYEPFIRRAAGLGKAPEGRESFRLDRERLAHWQSKGAQASHTVARLVKQHAQQGGAAIAAAA